MVVLEVQGGAVLGVAWPFPSSSASGPLRILYTLPALAATPLKGHGHTQHAPLYYDFDVV